MSKLCKIIQNRVKGNYRVPIFPGAEPFLLDSLSNLVCLF